MRRTIAILALGVALFLGGPWHHGPFHRIPGIHIACFEGFAGQPSGCRAVGPVEG